MIDLLRPLAAYLKTQLRATLAATGHNASGRLSQSVEVVVRRAMEGCVIEGSALTYGVYLEHGRKAGAKGVPIDALLDWIHQRNIEIEGMKDRSVAFMFQASIKRKGIEPARWIERTLEQAETRIDTDIETAMGKYVDAMIDTIFTQIQDHADH